MRKKILALFIASFMVVNIVSAAGSWGTFEGNNIVNVTVDGIPVDVLDVPAINYRNRTMVPIYLLKEAGVEFTWDQYEQTVKITTPPLKEPEIRVETKTEIVVKGVDIEQISKDMKINDVDFVMYSSDGEGMRTISYVYKSAMKDMPDTKFDSILRSSVTTPAVKTEIIDVNGLVFYVPTLSVSKFIKGEITGDQLIKEYKYDGNQEVQQGSGNQSNTSTNSFTYTQPAAQTQPTTNTQTSTQPTATEKTADTSFCTTLRADQAIEISNFDRNHDPFSGGTKYQRDMMLRNHQIQLQAQGCM